MKTILTFLTVAALGLAAGQTNASNIEQVFKRQQPSETWQIATAGPVWVGSWTCESRSSGGIQKIIAAANGDYTVSTDGYRFDGQWAAVSESEYYYLIPFVMEGTVKIKPTASGFTAIDASDTFDCTPAS